jgi:hypothetical protein
MPTRARRDRLTVPVELATQVESCKDLDQLDRWIERVLSATTLDDIFAAR